MPKPKSNAPAASSRGNRKSRRAASVTTLTPYMALSVDPRDAPVTAAHRPDSNSLPTVMWREADALTLSTNAQGDLWLDLLPQLPNCYGVATLDAARNITATTRYNIVNYAELQTSFTSWRPYSLAVEVEYVGRADEAKGIISVCTAAAGMAVADNVSMLVDEYDYKEANAAHGGVAASIRLHDNEDFVAITSGVDVNPSQYVHVACIGLPASSACVRLRYAVIGEYSAGHSKLMSRNAVHSYVRPAEVHASANIVGPNSSTAAGEEPYGQLVTYAKKAIKIGAQLNNLYKENEDSIRFAGEALMLLAA